MSKRPRIPPLLADLNKMGYDYLDGEGMDFHPMKEFLPQEQTRDWFQAWTGNPDVDGAEFLVFGQDGMGGYAAFWLQRPTEQLLEQPIVFLSSEGETAVIARDFPDYLWLLAAGYGPYEALADPLEPRRSCPPFEAFALKHAPSRRKTAPEIVAGARAEFPTFPDDIQAMCR